MYNSIFVLFPAAPMTTDILPQNYTSVQTYMYNPKTSKQMNKKCLKIKNIFHPFAAKKICRFVQSESNHR